jgi:hypothetical protein
VICVDFFDTEGHGAKRKEHGRESLFLNRVERT